MSRAVVKEGVNLPERSGRKRSASGLAPGATNYITARGAKRLRAELRKLRAANANSERIIGSERHLQIQPLFTRNMSRSSARADQFQDGVRCIYQWWRRRHHYHPKHYRFAGEMLRRFFYQIILADPVEQRLATTNIIELRSFCGHRCVSMLRCAVLSLCAGTAFRITRKPCLRSALGIGAGPILIAGRGGKLNASFSKKACRSGYNI